MISLVLGSALSNETPQGSSLTSMARTLSELHVFVTLLFESPKVTAKTASYPPAPGTPANNTPSKFIVASRRCVCDSGSICIHCNLWDCWNHERFKWSINQESKCEFLTPKLWLHFNTYYKSWTPCKYSIYANRLYKHDVDGIWTVKTVLWMNHGVHN